MTFLRSVKCVRALGLAAVLLGLCGPLGLSGQTTARAASGSAPARLQADGLDPELRVGREILLSGVGAGMLITGQLLPVDTRVVPFQGLDPAEISWGRDRAVVGNRSVRADDASGWTRNAALAFPLAIALLVAEPGGRLRGFGVRGLVYAETILLSQGATLLAKTSGDRPRPFAYLPQDQRPSGLSYDVSQERAFRSLPSGHSSSAWTGATIGMTDYLLSRPDASWAERVGVGLIGGGLAGATSALRVTAGQHFPSDVIAGAGIGIVTGVAVPLLHRGGRPLPSSEALFEVVGGALAGTLIGIVAAR